MQPARIAALLSLAFCIRAEDLLEELKRRSATEGLALIHWNGVPVEVLTFDGARRVTWSAPYPQFELISSTPYLSVAWFSGGGDIVAWNHHSRESDSCRDRMMVALPNVPPWQLSGSVMNVNALGVSAAGSRLAFDATYKPREPGRSTSLRTAPDG